MNNRFESNQRQSEYSETSKYGSVEPATLYEVPSTQSKREKEYQRIRMEIDKRVDRIEASVLNIDQEASLIQFTGALGISFKAFEDTDIRKGRKYSISDLLSSWYQADNPKMQKKLKGKVPRITREVLEERKQKDK